MSLRQVATHVAVLVGGFSLGAGSLALAQPHAETDLVHSQILRRIGNPYINGGTSGSLAGNIGDLRREIMGLETRMFRLCQLHGSSC